MVAPLRLYAGAREIAEIVRSPNVNTDLTLYFHADVLGSIDTISGDNHAIVSCSTRT